MWTQAGLITFGLAQGKALYIYMHAHAKNLSRQAGKLSRGLVP